MANGTHLITEQAEAYLGSILGATKHCTQLVMLVEGVRSIRFLKARSLSFYPPMTLFASTASKISIQDALQKTLRKFTNDIDRL